MLEKLLKGQSLNQLTFAYKFSKNVNGDKQFIYLYNGQKVKEYKTKPYTIMIIYEYENVVTISSLDHYVDEVAINLYYFDKWILEKGDLPDFNVQISINNKVLTDTENKNDSD